jgi:hypothetical protein
MNEDASNASCQQCLNRDLQPEVLLQNLIRLA